ncbi:DNA alkylation repair protein [Vibrio agarivorans]|uniref:DNA alkylation repair protein n=1 Tax=Vibrio agarivorans TaxID=153622 RepID=A0ABT7XYW8_9VIBR|nr:DNA alkylation repair protein [Vibrio agarivorans]MDN2480973.1 DNA alkylation repair protein [Vibrio agarivorans]
MHIWNQQVISLLEPLANEENARHMKAYMRGQFEFFGIKSGPRREALKPLFSRSDLPCVEHVPEVVQELWALPQREYQLVAIDLLIKQKKRLPESYLTNLEQLITTHSWWDTVDMLATHIASALFIQYPVQTSEYIQRWRESENIWLRRTALLYQLKFKADTDEALLFSLIKENQHDNEFFIQKAIGWVLREYSKTAPTSVINFIEEQGILGLARREALKWLNKSDLSE